MVNSPLTPSQGPLRASLRASAILLIYGRPRNLRGDCRPSTLTCLQPWHRQSRSGDPSGAKWLPWGRWCPSNQRARSMSGEEVETSQTEVDSNALEGFLVGNRDSERLGALLDAHHLLPLRGSPTRKGSGSMPSARRRSRSLCNEVCRALPAPKGGVGQPGDGLCRACAPKASAHRTSPICGECPPHLENLCISSSSPSLAS